MPSSGGWDSQMADSFEANAHLIAAAPELLAALEFFANELPSIIRQCCPNGVPMSVSEAHDKAAQAISKAKGR